MSADEDFSQLLSLDFDLDVEKLFNMTLNFEHLKTSLTFLFNAFKKQHSALKRLVHDNKELKEIIHDLKDQSQLRKECQDLKNRVRKLEETNSELSEKVGTLEARVEDQEDQLKEHKRSLTDLNKNDQKQDREIAELKKKLAILEKEIVLSSQFKKQIDEINRLKANQTEIQKIWEEIEILRESSGPVQTGPSSKELNLLRQELERRIAALQDIVGRIKQDMKDYSLRDLFEKVQALMEKVKQLEKTQEMHSTEIDDLKEKLRALQQQLNVLNETLDAKMNQAGDKGEPNSALDSALLRNLKLKVDLHQTKIAQLMKLLSELQSQMKDSKGKGASPAELNDLRDQIEALRKELNKLKQDLMSMLLALENRINSKADLEQLQELEKSILERLEAIVSGLNKKMADKNDTKKALKLLEKQIKNLYEMMQHRHQHDEDAMFSKKPLGGVSCASCEKDLINLYGKAADYYNWNRMPSRDPSERIARIGQGFSRLLSSIRVDYANKTQKLASPGSQPNMPLYEHEDNSAMNNTYSSKMYQNNPRHAANRPRTAGKVKTGHNMINSPSGDVFVDHRWGQQ